MNPAELDRIRALFPVLSSSIYFNHASTGPLPLTGIEAVTGYCRHQAETGQVPYDEAEAAVEETRRMLARLLHVAPETVAFTKNTSAGVTIAIGSTEWRDGDNVVLMEDDFPTVTYPFHYLLPGVQKRWCSSERLAEGPEAVFSLVDDRTRMVAVSWVHFLTGRRFDIAAVCRFCRERGVVTVVDAIQGIGVVDCDWDAVGADFVVSHGAKWLLAPQGSGFMRVRPEILPTLRPCNMGWLSAEWADFNDIFTLKPMKPGASRFEEGTKNYLAIYGLRESLRLFLAAGPAEVESRVRMLGARLRDRLEELGFEIATPAEPGRNAGIVTGVRPGDDSGLLHKRLADAKMICSLRENQLRIAPHFYNTEEEVDRFTELLAAPAGMAAKPAACPM
jgi:selenocysteine lyase/cysteine desulfurase